MIAWPWNSALIAELVGALAGHMVTSLNFFNPIIAFITFPILTDFQKIDNRLIFNLIFELFTRLARMGLVFAVQAVAF